jgi:hypothetical protein
VVTPTRRPCDRVGGLARVCERTQQSAAHRVPEQHCSVRAGACQPCAVRRKRDGSHLPAIVPQRIPRLGRRQPQSSRGSTWSACASSRAHSRPLSRLKSMIEPRPPPLATRPLPSGAKATERTPARSPQNALSGIEDGASVSQIKTWPSSPPDASSLEQGHHATDRHGAQCCWTDPILLACRSFSLASRPWALLPRRLLTISPDITSHS